MRKPVTSNVEIGRGETRHGILSSGNYADGTPLEIAYIIMRGVGDGPVVYVEACCHGAEINGLEVIRRLVTQEIDPNTLSGTLIFVPVTNVAAFNHRSSYTPFDSYDTGNMNRVWPGKASGSMTDRMAHVLWENLVSHADYVIDLHTGNATLVPHVVYMSGKGQSKEMARVFGIDVLVQEEVDPQWKEKRFAQKLRNTADEAGKPAICPEIGGNLRFEEDNIQKGVRGVLNVARWLRMLPGDPVVPDTYTVVQQAHLTQAKASKGGALLVKVKPGERVKAGQLIARVYSPRNFEILEEIVSPMDAIIIMLADNPIVHTGEFVAMLGKVLED